MYYIFWWKEWQAWRKPGWSKLRANGWRPDPIPWRLLSSSATVVMFSLTAKQISQIRASEISDISREWLIDSKCLIAGAEKQSSLHNISTLSWRNALAGSGFVMAEGPVRSALLEMAGSSQNKDICCKTEIKDETMVRLRFYDRLVTWQRQLWPFSAYCVHRWNFPQKKEKRKAKEHLRSAFHSHLYSCGNYLSFTENAMWCCLRRARQWMLYCQGIHMTWMWEHEW